MKTRENNGFGTNFEAQMELSNIKIDVVGAINGNNERYARDRGRIMGVAGVSMAITSRDYKDPPKIIVRKLHND